MKFELKSTTKKRLDVELNNSASSFFRAKKDGQSFTIGDILIMNVKRGDKWVPEKTGNGKLNQRYVFIHEDEFGVGYLTKLKTDGQLGEEVFCMATAFDYSTVSFQVDPEYAEAQFLGADLSAKDLQKSAMRSRTLATKANKKTGIKPSSLEEIKLFFSKLQPGDTFYSGQSFSGRHTNSYLIKKKEEIKLSEVTDIWNKKHFTQNWPHESTMIRITSDRVAHWGSTYLDETSWFHDYLNEVLWIAKPAKEEDYE